MKLALQILELNLMVNTIKSQEKKLLGPLLKNTFGIYQIILS